MKGLHFFHKNLSKPGSSELIKQVDIWCVKHENTKHHVIIETRTFYSDDGKTIQRATIRIQPCDDRHGLGEKRIGDNLPIIQVDPNPLPQRKNPNSFFKDNWGYLGEVGLFSDDEHFPQRRYNPLFGKRYHIFNGPDGLEAIIKKD